MISQIKQKDRETKTAIKKKAFYYSSCIIISFNLYCFEGLCFVTLFEDNKINPRIQAGRVPTDYIFAMGEHFINECYDQVARKVCNKCTGKSGWMNLRNYLDLLTCPGEKRSLVVLYCSGDFSRLNKKYPDTITATKVANTFSYRKYFCSHRLA